MVDAETFYKFVDIVVQFLKGWEVIPGLSLYLLSLLVVAAGAALALVYFIVDRSS